MNKNNRHSKTKNFSGLDFLWDVTFLYTDVKFIIKCLFNLCFFCCLIINMVIFVQMSQDFDDDLDD